MLREDKPAAESCGHPSLEEHISSLLPVGCEEELFNFGWDKDMEPFGSGDDHEDVVVDDKEQVTKAVPTWMLILTPTLSDTRKSNDANKAVNFPVTSNRLASRPPPLFNPISQIRHSSFQHVLQVHLNAFNKRLSMLEGNMLDMKESIRSLDNKLSQLNAQQIKPTAAQSLQDKDRKITELERSYTDMDTRLKRLEGRLEIVIDGFMALAQQMNKMKRARHVSRRPQEKRFLPTLSTVIAVPLYSTPQSVIRAEPTVLPVIFRATGPQSIPTPSVVLTQQRPLSVSQSEQKLKSGVTTTTTTAKSRAITKSATSPFPSKRTNKSKTTLGKRKTVPNATLGPPVPPQAERPKGSRSSATAKHNSKPIQTKSRKAKQEAVVTKFQLEPPAHKSKPGPTPQLHKHSDQAKKKDSLPLIKKRGQDKAAKSDAPVQKRLNDNLKEPSEEQSGNSKQNYRRPKEAPKNSSTGSNRTKPNTAMKKSTTKRTSNSNSKSTSLKKSDTTVKNQIRPSIPRKATKTKQPRKKAKSKSNVIDLLKLLNGDYKSSKRRKNQEASLHIVLGKVAIPIKIIPDD